MRAQDVSSGILGLSADSKGREISGAQSLAAPEVMVRRDKRGRHGSADDAARAASPQTRFGRQRKTRGGPTAPTQTSARERGRRDAVLDLLRACALIYIVCVEHLDDYTPALNFDNSVTRVATVCILGLFMFISGLLLSRRYHMAALSDVRRFYVRRLLRIYPMYLLASLGFMLAHITSPAMALKGVLCLNVLSGSSPATLWFVEITLWFYLVTPLLLAPVRRVRTSFLIGVALFAVLVLASRVSHGAVDLRLAQYFLIFLAGILAGRSERGMLLVNGAIPALCSVIALSLLWWGSTQVSDLWLFGVRVAAMLVSLPLFFRIAALLVRLVPVRLIAVISYCSFGAYLLHRLVFAAAIHVYQPSLAWTSVLYLLLGTVPVILALGWLFQWCSDRFSDLVSPHLLMSSAATGVRNP